MHHFLAEHDTGSGLRDLAFQQALVVLVVEELDVAGAAAVQPVFDGYVVDERLRLPVVNVLAGRDTAA